MSKNDPVQPIQPNPDNPPKFETSVPNGEVRPARPVPPADPDLAIQPLKGKTSFPLTTNQKKYLLRHYQKMSIDQFSDKFGRHKSVIKRYLAQKGLYDPTKIADDDEGDTIVGDIAKLDELERREYFEAELKNSKFYKELQAQFTEDELDYYVEEYGALAVQFSDVVATEKRQIDEFIKTEIMVNRVMKSIRKTDDDIEKLAQRIDQYRQDKDLDRDEQAQKIDEGMLMMIQRMNACAQQMGTEVQKLVKQKNDILEHLNARRKDRTDQVEQSKSTFLGLVEALRQNDIKKTQGEFLGLTVAAKNKKMKQWRKPNMFPDGSKEPILLDSETQFEDDENSEDVEVIDLNNPKEIKNLMPNAEKAATKFDDITDPGLIKPVDVELKKQKELLDQSSKELKKNIKDITKAIEEE